MKNLILGLAVSFTALQLHAEPELKGTAAELSQLLNGIPKSPVVTEVTGNAELKVPSDGAVVTFKITTDYKSLQSALRLNHDIRGKVLAYFKEQGLPVDRIESARFSSTPKYGWTGDKPKSYRVEDFVKIKIQDEKEFQAITGAIDSWNEVQYVGVEFTQGKKEEWKARVLAAACDKAMERKKIYEEKFGVHLTPRTFFEGSVLERLPAVNNAVPVRSSFGSSPASEPDVEEVTAPFGETTYTAQVRVEFTVEPPK